MIGKIIDKASQIKARLIGDQLDVALVAATTQDNWQASTAVLHDIASAAYNHQKWQRINQFLWYKLKYSKRWKKINKALNIVQFLLKNGPQYVANQLRYQLFYFKKTTTFTYLQEEVDRGAAIRQKAKIIVQLLQNQQLLMDQKAKAKKIRQNMSRINGNNNYSSSSSQVQKISNNRYYNQQKRYDTYKEQPKYNQIKYKQYQKQQQNTKNTNLNNDKKNNLYQKINNDLKLKKQEKRIVKPDLSYKNKKEDEILIDSQASFANQKYSFQSNKVKKQYNQIEQQNNPFQGVSFHQNIKTQKSKEKDNVLNNTNHKELNNNYNTPFATETVNNNQINHNYIQSSQVYNKPNYQPYQLYNQQSYQTNYNHYQNLYQNPYNQPYNQPNNQQYYYQPVNSSLQYQPYLPLDQPYVSNQPYQSSYSPYLAQNQPYLPPNQAYLPLSQPIISNKSIQTHTSTLGLQSINLTGPSNVKDSKSTITQSKKGNEWMSSTQKSLTDLGDLDLHLRQTKKQNKQILTNNIKIDPWAW